MFKSRRTPHLRQGIYVFGVLFLTFWVVLFSLNRTDPLKKIQERGTIRVGTLSSPLTYYYDRNIAKGYEYQLVKSFADYLGVELEITTSRDPRRLFDLLASRKVDMLAANLMTSEDRNNHFSAGPVYRKERLLAIYRKQQDYSPPKSLTQAQGKSIEVLVHSGETAALEYLKDDHENLVWTEVTDINRLDLLTRVQNRSSEIAIVPESLWQSFESYHPELAVAFELDLAQPVAWYSAKARENRLAEVIRVFFSREETNQLIEKLESAPAPAKNPLNYFDLTSFREAVEQRYVELKPLFEEAAENTGYDPLFLAAIGYQESHWKADAVSPTGVRGIMMLTEDAAADVGVNDRTDKRQSILGGAQYLKIIAAKIPDRIAEPDRTYFALAAYNIGFGHLEDARILTQREGDNPDSWKDVAKHLPKLEDPEYYPQTRYGQARGSEAVTYVSNIRRYQTILPTEAMLAQVRQINIVAPD